MGGAIKKSIKKSTKGILQAHNPKKLLKGDFKGAIKDAGTGLASALDPMNHSGAQGLEKAPQTAMVSDASVMAGMGAGAGDGTPQYASIRDASGNLKEGFKYDPTKSAAFNQLNQQAMAAPGESPWAQMQMQKQGLEQAGAADMAAKSQAQGLAQAQGNLMRQGGLSSGARTRMAMQGARDLATAQQGVAKAGMMDRLGIQGQDIDRKQGLLGNISSTELQAQGQNIGAMTGDVKDQSAFDMQKYAKQMEVLAANRTANAQAQAANSQKGSKK